MRLFEGTKWDIPPTCERCGQDPADCSCPPEPKKLQPEKPPEKQNVRLRKEKRKKGKIVTAISGLEFVNAENYRELLTELKSQCGTGGTLEDEVLVLQGDLVERLESALKQKGFKVKISN